MKNASASRFFIFTLMCCVLATSNVNANASDTTQTKCLLFGKNIPIGLLASCYVEKNKWSFNYSFSDNHHKGNKMGTEKVTNDFVFTQSGNMMSPLKMNMKTHLFTAMYGISNRLSAMATFGIKTNMMNMKPMPAYLAEELTGMDMSTMKMPTFCNAYGFGDTKLYLFYNAIKKCNFDIIIGGGINIPTGSITKNGPTIIGSSKRLAYSMQLGSGTFDLIPNISCVGQHNFWAYGAEAIANITPSTNRLGYSYGNQFNLNTWISYSFLKIFSATARIKGTSQGDIFGFDPALYQMRNNDPTDNPNNYGGKTAIAFAGLNFDIYNENEKYLGVKLECGMPLYQNLNGIQMRTSSTFQLGINFSY